MSDSYDDGGIEYYALNTKKGNYVLDPKIEGIFHYKEIYESLPEIKIDGESSKPVVEDDSDSSELQGETLVSSEYELQSDELDETEEQSDSPMDKDNNSTQTVNDFDEELSSNEVEKSEENSHKPKKEEKWMKRSEINVHQILKKRWIRLAIMPIIIALIISPLLSFDPDIDNSISISYGSSPSFEFGDASASLDWDLLGLSTSRTRYSLYMDDKEIDTGSLTKYNKTYSYLLQDLNLGFGNYNFRFVLEDSNNEISNLVSLSIQNFAPNLECGNEVDVFELNSLESIDFTITDKSVNKNRSYYEYSILNRSSNRIIKTEHIKVDSLETVSFPVSEFEAGLFEITLEFFDGYGMNSSIKKQFVIQENLAPRVSKSESKCLQVELGEIFTGYFDIVDYNNNENGSFLITLDENNNNPILSGTWDGLENRFGFSITTENLSLGQHSIYLVVSDALDYHSKVFLDFDLRISKDPIVSIDHLTFNPDYSDPYLYFNVSDYELYRNASYQINIDHHKIFGRLIEFTTLENNIEPNFEKCGIEVKINTTIENMPNTIFGRFELQKYLRLGENIINLTVSDGKGGLTTNIFTVIIEEPFIEEPILERSGNPIYFQKWFVLVYLYAIEILLNLVFCGLPWLFLYIKHRKPGYIKYWIKRKENMKHIDDKIKKKKNEIPSAIKIEQKKLENLQQDHKQKLEKQMEERIEKELEMGITEYTNKFNQIKVDIKAKMEKRYENEYKSSDEFENLKKVMYDHIIEIELLTFYENRLSELKEKYKEKIEKSKKNLNHQYEEDKKSLPKQMKQKKKRVKGELNEKRRLLRVIHNGITAPVLLSKRKISFGRVALIAFLLFLNLGIAQMLSSAQGYGGNFPISIFDIAPGWGNELNVTGWDENHTVMTVRVYDNLTLNWNTDTDADNVFRIKNSSDDETIYQERIWFSAGSHEHKIYMDPTRHWSRNFLPGQNYSISISLETDPYSGIPEIIGWSDVLNFTVIKAKPMVKFFAPEYDGSSPTGIYVVEHIHEPIPGDNHYELTYQCQIIDSYTSEPLRDMGVGVWLYNSSTQQYDEVTLGGTDIFGKFEYSENRQSLDEITIAKFKAIPNDFYESHEISSILYDENKFSTFDYSGPETITNQTSDGSEAYDVYSVNTLTEMEREFKWNLDENGWLLNDTNGNYITGVSEGLESLYFGCATGENASGIYMSPGIQFNGESIAYANITTIFSTLHDRNNFHDPTYEYGDIFDINLIIFDEDANIVTEKNLYNGGITSEKTISYSLSPTYFTKPRIFRIAYRITIKTHNETYSYDSPDEWYYLLKCVNFKISYDLPQYGYSADLSDWAGYSYEGRTKQMDCAFDTNSFSMFTRSGLTTSSSFGTISATGEVILDNAIDFTHADLQTSDILLNLNTEIQKIIYGGEEIDGSYSIYAIPILTNGLRLDPIYISSDSITSIQSNNSISLNLTSYLGQDIEKFAFKTWMSIDSEQIGTSDIYNIFFENVNISVNATETFDLVSVEDLASPPAYYVYRTLEELPNPITTFSPESEGFIVDKLVAGAFPQGTTEWENFVTINASHINSTYFYSDGSYVVPEDDPIYGSDETEQWTYLHTSNNYINFESIFSSHDYCAGYTFAYIYFPRLEESVFLKLGSNDGSRIWIDGEEVCYNHVIRSLGTRNSEEEHDIVDLGPMSAGWHRVMTMTENKDKKYVMRYRISSTNGTGDANFTPIDGLKIAVETPDYSPRFNPISMDCTPSKESKTDTNRNSLILGIPEQRVSQSETEIMSLSPVTDASGLTSTLFDGTLIM